MYDLYLRSYRKNQSGLLKWVSEYKRIEGLIPSVKRKKKRLCLSKTSD